MEQEEGNNLNDNSQSQAMAKPSNNQETPTENNKLGIKSPDRQGSQGSQGNNDPLGQEITDYSEDVLEEDINNDKDDIPTEKEKEKQRLIKEKAPQIQIGTPTDFTQPPQHPLLRDLKCTKVRWYRLHLTRGLVAFKGKDSIVIEIKYRINEGLELDPQGRAIHDEHLSELKIGTKLEEATRSVTVVKGYYEVNADSTRAEPIYGGTEGKEIQRGVWFSYDEKLDTVTPIAPEIANRLENHLEKFKPTREESFPEPLIDKNQTYKIVWKSVDHVELQKPNSEPVRLVRGHPEEAEWKDGNSEVKHLIFMVHGIAHNNKESSILLAAKRLGKGVDAQIKKADADDIRQIMFLPIHWRTLLKISEDHKCKMTMSSSVWNGARRRIMKRVHGDLMLYDCVECGPAIRNIVIQQLKYLYQKFRENNPKFTGPIFLLGHSLGSVICYDILTKHTGILDGAENQLGFEIDKLFIIGSPLRHFLSMRGQSAIEIFRRIVMLRRVLNTYHPNDVVAARLEPLIDDRFKKIFPVALKDEEDEEEDGERRACGFFEILAMSRLLALFTMGRRREEERGDHPMGGDFNRIDYRLQRKHIFYELWSHSIYVSHPAFHLFLVNKTIREEEQQRLLDVGEKVEQVEPTSSDIIASTGDIHNNSPDVDLQGLVEKLTISIQETQVTTAI